MWISWFVALAANVCLFTSSSFWGIRELIVSQGMGTSGKEGYGSFQAKCFLIWGSSREVLQFFDFHFTNSEHRFSSCSQWAPSPAHFAVVGPRLSCLDLLFHSILGFIGQFWAALAGYFVLWNNILIILIIWRCVFVGSDLVLAFSSVFHFVRGLGPGSTWWSGDTGQVVLQCTQRQQGQGFFSKLKEVYSFGLLET